MVIGQHQKAYPDGFMGIFFAIKEGRLAAVFDHTPKSKPVSTSTVEMYFVQIKTGSVHLY